MDNAQLNNEILKKHGILRKTKFTLLNVNSLRKDVVQLKWRKTHDLNWNLRNMFVVWKEDYTFLSAISLRKDVV